MGEFLKRQKVEQAAFRLVSPYFSSAARAEGVYKGKTRPFCLPLAHARENLFPGIRHTAPKLFARHGIKWHDGRGGQPSNHLCDSQVCCVNFLGPLGDRPNALATVLRPVFPAVARMLPVESGAYVTFEWIGQQNYLGERLSRNGKRTRGANFTSSDAMVMFERTDGARQAVLIEWKYTESYSHTSLRIARSGTDRAAIYAHLFERDDCPIAKEHLPSFDDLFYEPFYQFMRQQLLAHEMERVHELGADIVSVLHIAPACNTDFRRVTSPNLAHLGKTATDVWHTLVRAPGRFMSVSTEQLFGSLSAEQMPEMRPWLEYIGTRYPWVCPE